MAIKTVKPITKTKYKEVKPKTYIDMPLLMIVIMLVGLGLIMVLSASSPTALATKNDSYFYFYNQLKAAILGFVAMTILSFIPFQKWTKPIYWLIYLISIAVLFLVKIPGIGLSSGGAGRWVNIAGISFQPSELSKIGLILAFAGYFSNERRNFNKVISSVILPIIFLAIPVAILYKIENHLSAAMIVAVVLLIEIFMSGIDIKYIVTAFLGTSVLGGIAGYIFMQLKSDSFRIDRFEAWLHTEENATTTGYQTMQGLYAIGSGGLWGVGLGNSTQKYSYVPAAHNDFIFAILAEELGFVGCLAVIALFILFAIRGYLISIRAKDKYSSLVAIGITSLILIQAILNIAVVTNSMPNTGISLPFLSYGGTSLLILVASVGILLNISRTTKD